MLNSLQIWFILDRLIRYNNCQEKFGTGVVKVQGVGGGLKYYLFEKFRAYLLKNIKNFGIYLPIFVKNMEIFENSTRDFGADLLFSVHAMGQIYFQFEE